MRPDELIKKNVQAVMNSKGVSIDDLSYSTGISVVELKKAVYDADHEMDTEYIAPLAAALDVEPNDLYFGKSTRYKE